MKKLNLNSDIHCFFGILGFVALLFALYSFTDKNAEKIEWTKDYRVVWEDFKGKPNKLISAAALTSGETSYKYAVTQDSIIFIFSCYFNTNKSWVKERNANLLEHERGHFDITEIYVRRAVKEVMEYRKFSKNTKDEVIYKLCNKWLITEKDKAQDRYDHETDHSRKEEIQAKWNEKIAKDLVELEAFSVRRVAIALK